MVLDDLSKPSLTKPRGTSCMLSRVWRKATHSPTTQSPQLVSPAAHSALTRNEPGLPSSPESRVAPRYRTAKAAAADGSEEAKVTLCGATNCASARDGMEATPAAISSFTWSGERLPGCRMPPTHALSWQV